MSHSCCFFLVQINDPKHRASRGVLCVISNDVDFLETLKAARRNGWKTATVSGRPWKSYWKVGFQNNN
jgi:hypothetical protein